MLVGSAHSLPSENVTYPKLRSCVLLVAGMTGEQLLLLLWMLRVGLGCLFFTQRVPWAEVCSSLSLLEMSK